MSEALFMRRCMELASLGKGWSQSNPMVGALLVHQGEIIGAGGHRRLGGEHAEVHCLNQVAEENRSRIPQSTLYVNLEPCAHFGRTPPCADRIIEEGIGRVVVSNLDPFEKVNGSGLEKLRRAGVEVKLGPGKEWGLWLNRRFFCLHEQKRPYIILKWAASDQGYLAPPGGRRYGLSSAPAQWLNHKWRTEEGAILVGSRTARLDNPQLTPRLYPGNSPLRICLAPRGGLDPDLHLLRDGDPSWIFQSGTSRTEGALRFIDIPPRTEPIPFVLSYLHQELIPSLLVEGGARTLESFFDLGLWDETRIIQSPNPLSEGVPAPRVRHGEKIMDLPLGPDRLLVFLNKNSAYRYAEGMEL